MPSTMITDPLKAARAAKILRRQADESSQLSGTCHVNGCRIRPSIGRTGGALNVGWEIRYPDGHDQFYMTKGECVRMALATNTRETRT